MKIYYNPEAVSYHDHMLSEDSLQNRMRSIGESAWIFDRKYPELKKVPAFWKRTIFGLISNSYMLSIFKWISRPLYFYAVSKRYFLEGLKIGEKKYASFMR